jgi:hypothetical protein
LLAHAQMHLFPTTKLFSSILCLQASDLALDLIEVSLQLLAFSCEDTSTPRDGSKERRLLSSLDAKYQIWKICESNAFDVARALGYYPLSEVGLGKSKYLP